jgi:genome maintenance exonuclease 1
MNFEHLNMAQELPTLKRKNVNGSRLYAVPNGNAYPSVTTITGQLSKDSILAWRKRVGESEANKISGQASARGTRVHKLCEDYLNNELVETKQPMDNLMFSALKSTLDKHVGKVHALEAPLYSHHLRSAGTVDCIAEFGSKLSVIDFKTSKKLKKEQWIQNYFVQCSAYSVMYEELTGIPINRLVVIIAVDGEKDAQVFVKKRDDYIGEFIRLRDLYENTIA